MMPVVSHFPLSKLIRDLFADPQVSFCDRLLAGSATRSTGFRCFNHMRHQDILHCLSPTGIFIQIAVQILRLCIVTDFRAAQTSYDPHFCYSMNSDADRGVTLPLAEQISWC